MFDHLVITAANKAQARGYEAQLRDRERAGRLAGVGRWHVVSDPGDRRVGSGGSTFAVLHEVAGRLLAERPGAGSVAELFRGRRVLIVHSGGDSRRLVSYAAQGKVFTPLPCDIPSAGGGGSEPFPATLFDLILGELVALPAPPVERGQVLIAAGDVLLTFPREAVDFAGEGVIGVAYPGPVERGSKHGVYVAGGGDGGGGVADFLQKPDEATARARGAVDEVGRVLVDTGLISLDPPAVERWLGAAGVAVRRGRLRAGAGLLRDVLAGEAGSIDLYEQVLMALPPRADRERYLRLVGGAGGAAGRRRLGRLHDDLHGQPFRVCVLPYCEFFHIGTGRELLGNIGSLSRTSEQFGFRNFKRAVVADRAAMEGAFVYNARIGGAQVRAGRAVLVEACDTEAPLELPGRNIVVGMPGGLKRPVGLPEGWGAVWIPLRSREEAWAAVVFGIDDDFKTPRARGGTFGNRPLDAWMERFGVRARELWRAGEPEESLWTARLWPAGPAGRATALTAWMYGEGRGGARGLRAWRAARRLSMRDLLPRVDHERLIAHRDAVRRRVELASLTQRIDEDPWLPVDRVLALARTHAERLHALGLIEERVAQPQPPLKRARLHRLAAALAGETSAGAAGHIRDAFAAVADSVAAEAPPPPRQPRASMLHDQVVWVTTPVRIDLAGGWSDTPPICVELGGSVVNVAVTLNGQYPVQVVAKLTEEPAITLTSIDLGERLRLTEAREVYGAIDPRRWSALPLAALRLSGIVPREPKASLRRHLERFGGGVDLTLFSALPKGSGMGTSSVLGAATLACVARVSGETLSPAALIGRTSLLEQVMTTGGGWQDQIGGITPGAKLIRTTPGPDQSPSLHFVPLDLSPQSDLGSRTLLYFTGVKRMARDILQKVVGRYLARDAQTLRIVEELKAAAERMKIDLETGDTRGVTRGVNTYWRLKREIDEGSMNAQIEALLAPIDRYLEARLLPGAGGGGFVLMIARDDAAARKVREILTRRPPNAHARFFDFAVDEKGLATTLL